MRNQAKLIQWAQSNLSDPITATTKIADTAFSYVLKLDTHDRSYYLKQTPPKLYIEANVIKILRAQCRVDNVPTIIAKNQDLHCFLMPSCGQETLRTLFDSDAFDFGRFHQGLTSYIDLQKASATQINWFLEIGVPDWRDANLTNIYADFINDKKRLNEWQLNKEEQAMCQKSLPAFKRLCTELSALDLPPVLNHSDFHTNAMLLNQRTNTINIIDLGEVTIGNPLLSLATCLTNYLPHHHQITSNSAIYNAIQSEIKNHWHLNNKDINHLITLLGPLHYALAFRQLMQLCDHNFPKWRKWIKIVFLDYLYTLKQQYG